MQSKPQILAWITCDGVHIDPSTGKHTLLGIFSAIRARQFPVVYPHMMWFLTLAEVQAGERTLRILMGLDATRMAPLIERKFHAEGPLQRINLINEIRNLSFATPGEYSILIEVDEEPLLATSINVTH